MRLHQKETQYVIQYLRAVAAALVVFHHTAYEVIGAIPNDFFLKSSPGLVLVGAGGVDIFFVISGFIIFYTMTTQTGSSAAATFVRNRFVRVVPLYWFWTCILTAAMSTGLVLKNTPISPSMVASSFALIPYEKLPGNFHPVLDQGWTLSFEMYFYLVVAILISFVPYRLRLLAVIVILTLVQAIAFAMDLPPNLSFLFGSPLVYEFCAGAAIAHYGVPWSRNLSQRAKRRVGVGMLLLGAVTFVASAFFTEVREFRLLYWGAPSVLMVAGAVLANRAPEHSFSKLAFWFGTASYSLYLTHGFLTILLGAVLKRGVLTWIAPDVLTILATCVIIVLGSLTYLVVEKPLLNVFRRKNRPPYETASSNVSNLG